MNFLSIQAQIIYEQLDSFTTFHFWYPRNTRQKLSAPPPPPRAGMGAF